MELFSEIYGDSYRAVAEVLNEGSLRPLTRTDIDGILRQNASADEAFFISERLTGGQWPLLRKNADGTFSSVVGGSRLPLTALQRSWLAAILSDRRCTAFLSEEQRGEISAALDTEPMYADEDIERVRVCADSDPFDDPGYGRRLRTILEAIGESRILCISYNGGKGGRITGDFMPFRLEYSSKDDKLRLLAVRVRYGRAIFTTIINLARITDISPSRERYDGKPDFEAMRLKTRCPAPAVVELVDERNALERFMVQFASYEKRTRYLSEEDKYICSIYYRREEETELLIRLLSFGPVVRLLEPEGLVEQMKARVKKQWELMGQ